MAEGLLMTKSAAPATPAANKANVFIDTADFYTKMIDANGVISNFVNDGLQDRNIITNGGFNIQQRVATASTAIPSISTTTRAGRVADRWAVTVGNTTTCSWAQIDTSGATETGLQSRYYGKITQATNAAKFILSQYILNAEMAHLRGKKVRLSVKVKQFVGAGQTYKLGLLQLTAAGTTDTDPAFTSAIGADGVAPTWGTNLSAIAPDSSPVGENGTINGSYLDITSTSNWVRSSCVFTVPSDAKNLVVVLWKSAAGAATDSTGIAEFQLTQGPEIVDYVEPPLGETLMRCLRFFCKSFPLTVVPAASVSVATGGYGPSSILGKSGSGVANCCFIPVQFPVPMWKAPPTVTLFTPTAAGALVFRHTGTTPAVQGTTAVQTNATTNFGTIVTATSEATTNGAVGDLVSVHYTADAEFVA